MVDEFSFSFQIINPYRDTKCEVEKDQSCLLCHKKFNSVLQLQVYLFEDI